MVHRSRAQEQRTLQLLKRPVGPRTVREDQATFPPLLQPTQTQSRASVSYIHAVAHTQSRASVSYSHAVAHTQSRASVRAISML